MEGIAKINQKIINDATSEANKIVSDAQAQATEITKAEREKTSAEKKVIQERGKKAAAREEQRIRSSANLKVHNLKLESKANLIVNVISKVESHLNRMSRDGTGRYKKALKKLAEDGITELGEGSTLLFNKENSALGKELTKELNVKMGDSQELLGGVIIQHSSGTLRIDNSIERILERESEEIRGKIAELLFKAK
jgi:vacuolar-type H+-ATPase subunit E/Vma4